MLLPEVIRHLSMNNSFPRRSKDAVDLRARILQLRHKVLKLLSTAGELDLLSYARLRLQHTNTPGRVSDRSQERASSQTASAERSRRHSRARETHPRPPCGDDAYKEGWLADLVLILRPYGVVDPPLYVEYLLKVEGGAQQL
jgi:hypothetical protein